MPSKTEEYLALAQRTANGLTRYWESWTDYLTTASRLYKYPFADQLMIYAQRPDATACAEFDIWRNRMNRYVRRGSKGIALLDESSGFPRLHYVFDVSDTGVRRNSRDPEVWQLGPDLVQPVSEMLAATYGISGERVSQQLADVAGKLVADYWDNNSGDILAIVDGSLLMDYDEAGVEMQFKSAAAISVTYTLLERCGLEPAGWFDKDDFQAIYNFSTPDSVYALGAAVSDMSREVLRNIERTVKTTIRRRNAERSQYEYEQQERDLLDRRGLPSPEPDPEPAPEAAGQVRQAAPDVPDEPSPGAVQLDAPEREPVPASDGGGADGREPDAADHGAVAETDPGPGQGAESDGVGAAHEQPESTGRGTGADGADLQLSFFDAAIPTEAQQIEKIDQAESEKTPSAFVLSQAEIENELRKHGSGFMGGKQRIMALYQTQPDRKLRAKALAKEYGIGGHSHDFLDGSRGFVNHDWKGLEFDHYPDHQKITLKWAQVEKYIDLMIQSDRYLTDKEKEHYTPPAPVNAEPDTTLTHAKNLIREFCQEEYDSEPDFSDLTKIGIAYTNATDEEIPIQVNVDLVGYRVERYLGEVLIDERQYESLEDLTETELEALDFSELVSVTDEELEHYHSKAEERPALLPLDAAECNALKEQYPDALVGFEQNGYYEFYGEDARKVCELLGGKLLEKETALGTVPVTGFPSNQWVYRAKQLWQCGENVYLAGLNEDGTHHQTKYLRREDYLPLGATVHMEGRAFRVDTVNYDRGSVTLQDAFDVETIAKPMTRKSMREYALFIRSTLEYADENYGVKNPMHKIPALGSRSRSVDTIKKHQIKQLQDTLKESSMLEQVIVLSLLNSGVRRGELAGLTWKDVNFEECTIHISKSLLVFKDFGYQLTTTKESNIRDVDVAPEYMDFLKEYYKYWKSQKKLMGGSWQKSLDKKSSKYAPSLLALRGTDFVICNDHGFPINPDSYGALVRRIGQRAGIEGLHPHMFRHTFVSILLSNPEIGVATVAAEAGHAQPSTTLAIYTQVYDKRRKEIRNQMSKELYE